MDPSALIFTELANGCLDTLVAGKLFLSASEQCSHCSILKNIQLKFEMHIALLGLLKSNEMKDSSLGCEML